jgi:hypothetical protein
LIGWTSLERLGTERSHRRGSATSALEKPTPYRGEVADVYRYTITEKQYHAEAGRK